MDGMIEYKECRYKLSYTPEIIEVVEKILGYSIIGSIMQNQAMIQLSACKYMFIYGLMDIEGKRVSETKAQEIWNATLNDLGYEKVVALILLAFNRDCPFFFQQN